MPRRWNTAPARYNAIDGSSVACTALYVDRIMSGGSEQLIGWRDGAAVYERREGGRRWRLREINIVLLQLDSN